jgi:hypothetical protein
MSGVKSWSTGNSLVFGDDAQVEVWQTEKPARLDATSKAARRKSLDFIWKYLGKWSTSGIGGVRPA